ncbi:amidohydrolase [Penicillium sp. IBT 16267x]|nr:amidohydrolase [Penicillium sp. IBT 16267x]
MEAHSLRTIIESHRPGLEDYERIYREIHASPELSGQEKQTSKIVECHLKELGFEVHARIGGYGVAGTFNNGSGATILLRADMDALPMKEKTGLPYASQRVAKDTDGNERPVAFHVVSLMASAALMCSARKEWSGTLICVFQPAEETLSGAQAMIDDGLFDKIPKPDLVLAQHVMRMRAGQVSVRSGRLLTAADSFEVRIFGQGGHASTPDACIDAVVIGAAVVSRLQTIVSREVNPHDLAIVSCGSINAGYNANIIPDECIIRINVRTYDPKTRERVIKSIERIVKAECLASGATEEPTIRSLASAPATVNDDEVATALRKVFSSYFQESFVEGEPATASEDFSLLAAAANAAYAMWTFGGIDEKTWDHAVQNDTLHNVGGNHSPYFAPVLEPTLRTGVDAMSVSALHFLRKISQV